MRLNNKVSLLIILFFSVCISNTYSQSSLIWMSAGSLQNWYSSYGCEIELGANPSQEEEEYGMRWPSLYQYQDIQCAKGVWIGVKNFKDASNKNWTSKVVHIGPRVNGANEIFPVSHILKTKYPKPVVKVDGVVSQTEASQSPVNVVDPTLQGDMEIETVDNTLIGVTMHRRVFQFSNTFHDNYIVNEYTLTNTGKANPDDINAITYPGQNLDSLYFFTQFRLSVLKNTRYIFGNSTGWGINTTNDVRGDGQTTTIVNPPNWSSPSEESMRCQFSWNGKYSAWTAIPGIDNIGGPMWVPAQWVVATDTVGRLGASQFAGILTLFAPTSATDSTDDITQPATTITFHSDDPLTQNNDANDLAKCNSEYAMISRGHDPRHIQKMGETDLISPSKDPSLGQTGGQSFGNGYGPYNLAFGQSIKIIFVEAVNGMSHDAGVTVGHQLKWGQINNSQKNTEVMKGKDSLMMTFRRAIDNYKSNWQNAKSPMPPKEFFVTGTPDSIALNWSTFTDNDPELTGFIISRAIGQRDSTYHQIAFLPASARSSFDKKVPRGVNVYYTIQSVGAQINANPTLGIWGGNALSNLNVTLMADPTFLKKDVGAGGTLKPTDIRVVPNPYNYSADLNNLRFGSETPNRLFFFNIPGSCTIRIYTEYGELIKSIEHTDGSADEPWDCITNYNQIVVSGIYIAVIKDHATGTAKTVKFVVIR